MLKNPLERLLQRLPRWAHVLADWVIGIVVAVAIVLALRAWVVTPYAIPTASMEPTLHCAGTSRSTEAPTSSVQPGQGSTQTAPSQPAPISPNQCEGGAFLGIHFADRILVSRLSYDFGSPHRGDIVVFKPPEDAAKICGGTFDTSVLVKRLIGLPGEKVSERNGFVFIDGKKLSEPYVQPGRRDDRSGTWKVPKDGYFFMGDNRIGSCDSRNWGSVPRRDLIGPVFMTYWPPNRISFH
jgi:signal peptidase I